jgi:hypothetical protein
LKDKVTADENDVTAVAIAKLLFETSLIESGFTPDDTKAFSQRVYELAKDAVGVTEPLDAIEEEIPEPEEEAAPAEEAKDESDKDEL